MTKVHFEGFTADELLALSDEEIDALVLRHEPVVARIGTADVLGDFRVSDDRLVLELAEIDGGGEGILPALGALAQKYAQNRGLSYVEWILHATKCANPNPKLRRLLERRNFEIREVPGSGEVYYQLAPVQPLDDV